MLSCVLRAALCCCLLLTCSTASAQHPTPPVLDSDSLPSTNFTCREKVIGGYYADVYTGCQMFHVCTLDEKGEIHDYKFRCLAGTVFDQETRVCERAEDVDCTRSEAFFHLNNELYGPGIIPSTAHIRVSDTVEHVTSLPELVPTTQPPFVFPETSFSCLDKIPGGLYADVEAGCAVFHICSVEPDMSTKDNKFVCGAGTLFDQKSRTCQVAAEVDCSRAESFYYLNDPLRGPDGGVDMCRTRPLGKPLADLTSGCRHYTVCEVVGAGRVMERRQECKKGDKFSQLRHRCVAEKKVNCAKETLAEILGLGLRQDTSSRGKRRATSILVAHRFRRSALQPLTNLLSDSGSEDARVRRALYNLAALQQWAQDNARHTAFLDVYTLNTWNQHGIFPKKLYSDGASVATPEALYRYSYVSRKKRDVINDTVVEQELNGDKNEDGINPSTASQARPVLPSLSTTTITGSPTQTLYVTVTPTTPTVTVTETTTHIIKTIVSTVVTTLPVPATTAAPAPTTAPPVADASVEPSLDGTPTALSTTETPTTTPKQPSIDSSSTSSEQPQQATPVLEPNNEAATQLAAQNSTADATTEAVDENNKENGNEGSQTAAQETNVEVVSVENGDNNPDTNTTTTTTAMPVVVTEANEAVNASVTTDDPHDFPIPEGSINVTTTVLPANLTTEATPTNGLFNRANIPETNFTCKDKKLEQFYPDTEANCQVFHYCSPGFVEQQVLDLKFLCTGDTMFDINTQKCEDSDTVTCPSCPVADPASCPTPSEPTTTSEATTIIPEGTNATTVAEPTTTPVPVTTPVVEDGDFANMTDTVIEAVKASENLTLSAKIEEEISPEVTTTEEPEITTFLGPESSRQEKPSTTQAPPHTTQPEVSTEASTSEQPSTASQETSTAATTQTPAADQVLVEGAEKDIPATTTAAPETTTSSTTTTTTTSTTTTTASTTPSTTASTPASTTTTTTIASGEGHQTEPAL